MALIEAIYSEELMQLGNEKGCAARKQQQGKSKGANCWTGSLVGDEQSTTLSEPDHVSSSTQMSAIIDAGGANSVLQVTVHRT